LGRRLCVLAPAVGDRVIGIGTVIKASSRTVVAQAEVFVERAGGRKLVAFALATLAKVEGK
jgi:acyl-coenzyme A thioesterase PaaI-like protein